MMRVIHPVIRQRRKPNTTNTPASLATAIAASGHRVVIINTDFQSLGIYAVFEFNS